MKKMKSVLILLFVLQAMSAYAQTKRKNVLILPFKNIVRSSDFSSSEMDNFRDMSFHAFYNFFGTLPFTEVPERGTLRRIHWTTENIESIASSRSAEYTIFGTFSFKGNKQEPEVVVNLKVLSKAKKLVFQRSYTTLLDLDIFDTIDSMVLDTLEAAFNIKAQIANLDFNNFSISKDEYKLYINNKEMATIKNADFNLSLKILADTDYHILVERVKDKVAVYTEKIRLADGDNHLVSYQARGDLNIKPILYKEKNKNYKVFLNGTETYPGTILTNLNVGIPYHLMIIDNQKVIQDKHSFTLIDGEMVSIQPLINWGGTIHFRSFFLGGSIAGLGADLHLSRPLWIGLSSGFTYVSKPSGTSNVNIFAFNPSVDVGWYVIGHMNTDFRLGAGLSVGSMFALPQAAWDLIAPDSPSLSFVPGAFIDVEWKNIFARLLVVYDFSATQHVGVYPLIGFKI